MIHPVAVNNRIAATLRTITTTMGAVREYLTTSETRILSAQIEALAVVCQEQQRRIETLEGEMGGRL